MARTCRQVIELLAFEAQRSLIPKQVGIVEGRLVHELERLRDEEAGQNGEVDLPADAPGLGVRDLEVQALAVFPVTDRVSDDSVLRRIRVSQDPCRAPWIMSKLLTSCRASDFG